MATAVRQATIKRKSKAPQATGKVEATDDWLSPMINAAFTLAGGAVGGPIGAMAGSAVGGAAGGAAADAAGMKPTAVTEAVNMASSLGQGVAGAAGIPGGSTGEVGDQIAGLLGIGGGPDIPPMAQPGVEAGRRMANQVAGEGLAASSLARPAYSDLLYQETGAYTRPSMNVQPLPQGMRGVPQDAIGVVPTQGFLYEATPEAAQRRRQQMLGGMVERQEADLMRDPYYAMARQQQEEERLLQDAEMQRLAAEEELKAYKRRLDVPTDFSVFKY